MQKFQNMEHSNSRTFQELSRTYSVFKDFQGPGIFFQKFKDFQGLLKDPMNPVIWDDRSFFIMARYIARSCEDVLPAFSNHSEELL